MKPIKKLVAVTGKYTDRQGNEKNQYTTCGKLLQRDDGSLCVKLDSIPVVFNGWLNCYDLDENRQQNNQQGMAQAKAAVQQRGAEIDYESGKSATNYADFDDDIPF